MIFMWGVVVMMWKMDFCFFLMNMIVMFLLFLEICIFCMSFNCFIVFKSLCIGFRCNWVVLSVLVISNMFMFLLENVMVKVMVKCIVIDLLFCFGVIMIYILWFIVLKIWFIFLVIFVFGNLGLYVIIFGVVRCNKCRILWMYWFVLFFMSCLNMFNRKYCK